MDGSFPHSSAHVSFGLSRTDQWQHIQAIKSILQSIVDLLMEQKSLPSPVGNIPNGRAKGVGEHACSMTDERSFLTNECQTLEGVDHSRNRQSKAHSFCFSRKLNPTSAAWESKRQLFLSAHCGSCGNSLFPTNSGFLQVQFDLG